MNQKDSLFLRDWMLIAKKDWERINRQIKDGDPEAGGYFLQQSLEKYLKAFLIKQGWKLKKIHALHDLLSEAVTYDRGLEKFRKLCERVSGYYLLGRYPPLIPTELTCEDIMRDMKEAEEFIKSMFGEEIWEISY